MAYPSLGSSKEGTSAAVVQIVFEVLAIIAIALRIWSRRLKRTSFVLNDYAAIVALVRESMSVPENGCSKSILQVLTSGLTVVSLLSEHSWLPMYLVADP